MEINDTYDIIRKLGEGAFSNVFLATHRPSGVQVAIKIIKKEIFNDSSDGNFSYSDVLREVEILRTTNHPNIVKLFDYHEDKNNFYIVQELCDHGTVVEYIKNNGNSENPEIKLIFLQLVNAVSYLHEVAGILHCDIKAENVLLDSNNNVKLVDFGFAYDHKNNDDNDVSAYQKIKGTPAYIAPEVLQNYPNSIESDTWSIGVFLYYLITGTLPFDDDELTGLAHCIIKMKPSFPSYLSSNSIQLLTKILKKNPKERCTLNQIKNSAWLKNISEELDNTYQNINYGNDEIDSEIVQQIIKNFPFKFGSFKEICDDIKKGRINPTTVYYNILLNKKKNEILNNYLKPLKKKIEIRCPSIFSVDHKPNSSPKSRSVSTNRVGLNNCNASTKKRILICSKASIPKLINPIKYLK